MEVEEHEAYVAGLSVGFGGKERLRNAILGILPMRKIGREPKLKDGGIAL